MNINWKRFLWVIFIYIYLGLFFYNFLRPYNNWLVYYIYTMLLIVWLGTEYYQRQLFFQTGFVPIDLYSWPLRALFALFFYSSFIIGISTIAWWHKNQIGLYPFIQIIGIVLLISSVLLRRESTSEKRVTRTTITHFYWSIILLGSSLAFGYGSRFSVAFVIIIGIPLIILQKRFEHEELKNFETFVISRQNTAKSEEKDYHNLWRQYVERQLKKKGKRSKKGS